MIWGGGIGGIWNFWKIVLCDGSMCVEWLKLSWRVKIFLEEELLGEKWKKRKKMKESLCFKINIGGSERIGDKVGKVGKI